MLAIDVRFIGVYIPVYNTMLIAPNVAVIGLTRLANIPTPLMPVVIPTTMAWNGLAGLDA